MRAGLGDAAIEIDVGVTPGGLLAIGGMVAMMLLSSAVIVGVARMPRTQGLPAARRG